MLSTATYYKDFLLLDADSRRALEYVSRLDSNWEIGPVTINQVGERIQVLFWEDKKSSQRIKEAIKIANDYSISVRRVTFK